MVHARRGGVFSFLIAAIATDVVDSWMKGTEYLLSLGPAYIIAASTQIALCVIAILVRNPTYHGVMATGMVLYQLSWAVRGYESVG